MDNSGNVYVVDPGNARVMKWTPGAVVGSIAAGGNGLGSGTNQLSSPDGLFLDPATSIIWIADTYNHRIVRWSSPSSSTVVCGSYGTNANQFNYPRGVFVDISNSNTVYVADTANHRVQKWLSGASSGTTVAGQTSVSGNGFNQLYFPQTVIVDTNGNLFISDSGNNRIMRWAAGSNYGLPVAGGAGFGSRPNLLNGPQGLRFDPTGALVVADFQNHRVQRFAVSCRE